MEHLYVGLYYPNEVYTSLDLHWMNWHEEGLRLQIWHIKVKGFCGLRLKMVSVVSAYKSGKSYIKLLFDP